MAEPTINVIRPQGGTNFRFPKVSPLLIILATVLLAVISVVTAVFLYQRRNQAVAPTAPVSRPRAATTTTISDNFDGASLDTSKWTTSGDAVGATANQTSGKLQINIPVQTAQRFYSVHTLQAFTGDLSAEVNLDSVTTGDSGSVEFFFSQAGVGPKARVSRYKSPTGERLETEFDTVGKTSIDLPANTGSIKAKIVRVGSSLQTFYDSGSGFVLLGSVPTGFAGDGIFELDSVVFAPQYPVTAATFDNFTAQGNLVGAAAPTPGTAAACTVSFNVLTLASTPTPGATPSPSPSPSVSPSPSPTSTPTTVPTPTPTPTPTPLASCNNSCTANSDCSGSMICNSGMCRNPSCTATANCVCALPTPTPLAQAPAPTPTPVTLQQAGSTTGTWIISITGAALLILGSSLLFVL